MTQESNRSPGWDAKAISEIANRRYGGFEKMFEAHGWPETGPDMMPKVQARVKETYGSVEEFVKRHRDD